MCRLRIDQNGTWQIIAITYKTNILESTAKVHLHNT
uniref:Uncharacterized protein n=1 Tax=Rhizophora mucronata TaxID=61149 RepID=A0A2P2QI73_RHIMU